MSEPLNNGVGEPYKPLSIIEIAQIPNGIEIPRTDEEIVSAAKFIVRQERKSSAFLPTEYKDLEIWFNDIYKASYSDSKWIDVAPKSLDYLFQQYAIKNDEKLDKNAFNTFGLYAVSYLEALHTVGIREGYLGTGGWDHYKKEKYRGLLLGCSSITTANEFFRFVEAINPEAEAIVVDIDPLATKLSKEGIENNATQMVMQADAQRILLPNNSVNFIATNFLIQNLIDVEKADKDTLPNIFKEVKRVLAPNGRLSMVEPLGRNDLEWVSYYAHEQGLDMATGGPGGGIQKSAVILKNHLRFSDMVKGMSKFIDQSKTRDAYNGTSYFSTKPNDYFGGNKQSNVTNLIFRHDLH